MSKDRIEKIEDYDVNIVAVIPANLAKNLNAKTLDELVSKSETYYKEHIEEINSLQYANGYLYSYEIDIDNLDFSKVEILRDTNLLIKLLSKTSDRLYIPTKEPVFKKDNMKNILFFNKEELYFNE